MNRDMAKAITDYYCALNELAAMLADKVISEQDWTVQSAMMHMYWKDNNI
jgi:hypothetical protein